VARRVQRMTLSGRIFGRITQKGSNKKKRGLTNKAKLWLILYSNGQKGMKFKKVSFPSLLLTNYRQVQDLLYFSFRHIVFFQNAKCLYTVKEKLLGAKYFPTVAKFFCRIGLKSRPRVGCQENRTSSQPTPPPIPPPAHSIYQLTS
jgi:hypothetical protein